MKFVSKHRYAVVITINDHDNGDERGQTNTIGMTNYFQHLRVKVKAKKRTKIIWPKKKKSHHWLKKGEIFINYLSPEALASQKSETVLGFAGSVWLQVLN